MKVRIGISFDEEVTDILDAQVRLSPDPALDRSEVVNAVVKAPLKAGLDHRARAASTTELFKMRFGEWRTYASKWSRTRGRSRLEH